LKFRIGAAAVPLLASAALPGAASAQAQQTVNAPDVIELSGAGAVSGTNWMVEQNAKSALELSDFGIAL